MEVEGVEVVHLHELQDYVVVEWEQVYQQIVVVEWEELKQVSQQIVVVELEEWEQVCQQIVVVELVEWEHNSLVEPVEPSASDGLDEEEEGPVSAES